MSMAGGRSGASDTGGRCVWGLKRRPNCPKLRKTGDSMVAGFIAGYLKEHDFETALRLGTAAGSASAFSEGLADSEEVYKLLERM